MVAFDETKRLMTLDEVGQVLRVDETLKHPRKYLCRQIRLGRLKAAKVGRTYRVRCCDLDRFIDDLFRNSLE